MRFALVLYLIGSAAHAQVLETHIRFPFWHPWPGGLSGLAMAEDGASLLAVTDDGVLLDVTIERDRDGQITGFGPPETSDLLPPDGTDWPETWLYHDAEALAAMPDGRIIVAYEGLHRLALHERDGTFRRWYQPPEEVMAALEVNLGFEAVATTPEGQIIAIPEAWEPDPTRVPIWTIDPDTREWTELGPLPLSDGFAPTGLDRAGRHYLLLERRFHWLWGFSSRIRRFEVLEGAVTDLTILLETPPDRFGNLEALALWHRDNTLIATALSDNNQNPLLPQDLLEWTFPAASELSR